MTKAVKTRFPRPVRVIENEWIPLSDGCRLAARIWLPEDVEADPVPALLEYIPYRKGDDYGRPGCDAALLLRRPRLRVRARRHAGERRV